MSKTIPLIRAGAIAPMIRWMTVNRRPLEHYLRQADLSYALFINPNLPIPLHNAAKLFAIAARSEGPDIGCRVVSETSIHDLALIGRVALGAATPREAITRAANTLPYHCSHEVIHIQKIAGGISVREGWTTKFDDLTLHVIQQFVASILQLICGLTHARGPLLKQIEMVPHPDLGFDHLGGWFSGLPVPSRDRSLRIEIDAAVSDRRYFTIARDRTGGKVPPEARPLTGDGTLSTSAKTVLEGQLSYGTPTIDRLAGAAGLSRRTLQRQLAAEGTSFSALLEDVRQAVAIQHLKTHAGSLDDVAARLGYARQSTLTRAVRRWTGQTPSALRNGAR